MSRKQDVHTVPSPWGRGWINRVGGVWTGTVHRTQRKARLVGREVARRNESEHAIHRKDGTIGEKNSYGPDAFPPRG
jgi:hypothetical protein